jgi:uncharacterized membrane protein YdbT with pleckstrin-like domain
VALLPRFLVDPQIGRHLLRDEGEVIVDEVRKHWVVYVVPALIAAVGVLLLGVFLFASVQVAWLPLVVALALFAWAGWVALAANMDRFVITNMRVFRIKGVLARSQATMPLGRILDITVVKPMTGRVLGYGHFTFESAAQDQGLRDIRFVGDPDGRDLAIQRVVQRAGLRGAPRFSA